MRNIFVRSPYNYDADLVSRETSVNCDESEDMTQQSFKEECDINTLVRRFGITGLMPQNMVPPTFQMFEDVFDFHSAMNAIAEARESFDALPAETRYKFQNDPQKFVEFCADPKNVDEMVEMGLAIARPVADNTPAPSSEAKETTDVKRATGGAKDVVKAGSGSAASGGGDQGQS